jgi:hypothetical protein
VALLFFHLPHYFLLLKFEFNSQFLLDSQTLFLDASFSFLCCFVLFALLDLKDLIVSEIPIDAINILLNLVLFVVMHRQ